MDRPDEKNQEELVVDQPEIAAFFLFEKNHREANITIRPFLQGKLVAWEVKGDNILALLQKIYNDTPIPINSYLRDLKEIRSQIYIFKGVK